MNEIISLLGVREGDRILDPFCGSGTTLLVAAESGIEAVGYDVMRFPVFVSNTKLLRPRIAAIKKYERFFSVKTIDAIKTKIKFDISTINKVFDKKTLNFLVRFREKIRRIDDPGVRAIFLLCLLKTLEPVSNSKKSGGFLRIVEKENLRKRDVLRIFKKYLAEVKDDIRSNEITFRGNARAFVGDSRNIQPDEIFDAVISSPPYPNRHDYTRVYLLEEAIGFDRNDREIKQVRYKTLRSHVEAKKQFEAEGYTKPKELQEILEKMAKKELNNSKIIEMLEGFFEDMFITLKALKKIVKRGGRIAFVISNARYAGVGVPTDTLLSQIGELAGLKPESILVLRYRGNSYQQTVKYNKDPARESLVVWKNCGH
ncbi:MAG: hypothetical protein HYW25_02470 [Candidatus Aenigmarchaeota archaeon]|nr:hypothetical protein [Candidatus Aenigmarchaeota archaeon]